MLEYLEESTEHGVAQLFIASRQNVLLRIWQVMITILCLASSFIYANYAAFRMHKNRDHEVIVTMYATFEIIFFIDMILQFFIEYVPEG